MTSHVKNLFVPAAGVHWLTRFYDPALALLTRERTWRPRLVDQVAAQPEERILDLGCGTGTLTLMIQQACAEAEIIGLDVDRDVLRIARKKAAAASIHVSFWQGRADDQSIMPMFRFASFDKIVSSLFFHHLSRDQKLRAFRHARNLLRPGGVVHVADWGRPANPLMRILFFSVQGLDGYSNTSDNVAGRLPEFMREAGFTGVTETHRINTMLGTLCFYRGVRD
jgi:ubiquinone/menaquinone biosynthesis C-methylase UbiE